MLIYNIGERRLEDGKIKIRIFESAIYIAYCATSTSNSRSFISTTLVTQGIDTGAYYSPG